MAALNAETVLSVHHWTETLFSFELTRPPTFRFDNGQFAMIGLLVDGRPLLRAYSMVSANHEERLEFLSIKVPDGPLTSRLQHLRTGDRVMVSRKPAGTLVLSNLLPGRTLYLLATGTGLAPFLSLIRGPETYERFEQVVLVHGCRTVVELAYRDVIGTTLPQDEFLGEMVRERLIYFPTVTREPFRSRGRITELVESGQLCAQLSLPPLDARDDRVMICGSPGFLRTTRMLLEGRGFREGASAEPGHFALEKAFVEG